MSRRTPVARLRPLGRLATGEPYYAPIGAMLYERDLVCCHLCGRWLQLVGGQHLIAAHGITLLEYREMFCLFGNVTTAAPDLTERKRRSMLEQIASGERDQSVLGAPSPPTVGRWRSLAVLRPDLLQEWHRTRNGELDPHTLGQSTHRRVWWHCGKCGHEWRTSPNERTSAGKGCPACGRRRSIAATVDRNRLAHVPRGRSLAVRRPDLLQEWHPTRNGELDPATVGAGSERKVWWTCSNENCGNAWQAVVGDRAKRGLGCPACSYRAGERRALAQADRSLGALYPQLLTEWHPTRNSGLDPYAIKPGSERQLWWQCSYCGRDWQAPANSRKRSARGGCPTCAIRLARGVDLKRRLRNSQLEAVTIEPA
jgi:Probable Zinc-ribbon domain/ROS/MUCR transcriptional regulator protein